jgi:hypothetical protein
LLRMEGARKSTERHVDSGCEKRRRSEDEHELEKIWTAVTYVVVRPCSAIVAECFSCYTCQLT